MLGLEGIHFWKLTGDFRCASNWNIPFTMCLLFAFHIICSLSCELCSSKFMQLVSTSCCLAKHRLWWMSPRTTNRLVYPTVFSWKHYKLSRCLHLQCKNQMLWYPNCFINWKSYRWLAKQFSSLLMGDYSENSKINTQKHKTRKQFPLGVNNGFRASSRNQCAAWVSGLQSVESLLGEGQKIFL